MKKLLYILLICIPLLFLTACWNYREIDKSSLLAGVAVDRDKQTDEYELTAEIVDVNAAGKEAKFNSLLLSSKAKSIHDASRKMISLSAKQLYWSHATSVIISEDIAKDGMIHLLDWLVRDYEPRLNLYLFVAQTQRAEDILNLESVSTEIRSFEMSTIIESHKKTSMISKLEIYELINMISKTGIDPVVPTVKEVLNQGKKTMDVSGGAIFKGDKFVGYIDEEEIKYYLFGLDEFKKGLLIVDLKDKDSDSDVTIEILKSKSNIKPIFENDKLKMKIKIKAEGNISAIDSDFDIIKGSNIIRVKKNAEKCLKDNLLTLLNKAQKQYNADIFGFGENVKGKMPKLWKEIEDDWDSIYKDLDVDVSVDIHIKASGHFSKTLISY